MTNSNEVLDDRSAPAAQRIADLAKMGAAPGKSVLIEDEEPLLNAIHAGVKFDAVYVLDSVDVPEVVEQACRKHGFTLQVMSAQLATRLFKSDKRPDIFGVARMPRPVRPERFQNQERDILILDGVRIVGNIGAIVRSALAFGAGGIILVDSGLKSIADRRLIRASRGYVFSLPVAIMTWEQVSQLIDATGLPTVVLDAHGGADLAQLSQRSEPLAFVLGAETVGPSEQASRAASLTISIPMNSAVESLNVSVTAGVLLHARSARNLTL